MAMVRESHKQHRIAKNSDFRGEPPSTAQIPQRVPVLRGETLLAVTARIYGSGNKLRIRKDPEKEEKKD
jgi:hypothetical protein